MHLQSLIIDLLLLSSLVGSAYAKPRKNKAKRTGSASDAGGKRTARNEDKDIADQAEKRSKSRSKNKTPDSRNSRLQESDNRSNDNHRPVDAGRAFVFSWHRNDLRIKTDDYR